MAEWFKAHAWKVCVLLKVPRVRIPVSPPLINKNYLALKFNYLVTLKVGLIRGGKNMNGRYVLEKNELNKTEYLISLGMGSERNNLLKE